MRFHQVNVCDPRSKYFTGGCDFKIYIRHIFPHGSSLGGNSRRLKESLVSSQDNHLHVRNPTSYYGEEHRMLYVCVNILPESRASLDPRSRVIHLSPNHILSPTYACTHTLLYTPNPCCSLFSTSRPNHINP